MRRFKLPNMGALLAFEAAARHQSFTQAARELALTESAVSRQINGLEQNLGVELFVRARQRVILTRAGRLYSAQVRRALEHLDRDTLAIIAHGSGGSYLELAALPTFASEWLIPRLPGFNLLHPDILVNMGIRTEKFIFEDTPFEAAIHFGKPSWPGASADYLFGESVIPVCRPELLRSQVTCPADLLDYPLLHSTTRPEAWSSWFARTGIDDPRSMQGVRYELHSMLISGAAAGLGIALVPAFLVQSQMAALGLVTPFDHSLVTDNAYYLVYPVEMRHSKPLEAFRGWLLAEAGAFRQQGGA